MFIVLNDNKMLASFLDPIVCNLTSELFLSLDLPNVGTTSGIQSKIRLWKRQNRIE